MRENAGNPGASGLFAHPGVDWPTLGLLAGMYGGLVLNFWWRRTDPQPALVHAVVGLLFLNLSFTVWHEGVHGTVFRSRWANDLVGVLGALPAAIPYFALRRVHRLHHDHTNEPGRDPDLWFAEAPFWKLPFRFLRGAVRTRRMVLETRPPTWERLANRATVLLIAGLLVLAWREGALGAALWCWAVPKFCVVWIHAWYVNYLPHHELPAERYRDTRVYPLAWLCPVMLCHNYHGFHHAWQTVPWHRYSRAFREKRRFLEERGTPIRTRLAQR